MGFMSGGMVADSVSEGFCNYLICRLREEAFRPLRLNAFQGLDSIPNWSTLREEVLGVDSCGGVMVEFLHYIAEGVLVVWGCLRQ